MESRCFLRLENALSDSDQFPGKGYLLCVWVLRAFGTYPQPRRSWGASRSNFSIGASLSFFTTGTRRTLGPSSTRLALVAALSFGTSWTRLTLGSNTKQWLNHICHNSLADKYQGLLMDQLKRALGL